MGITPAILRLIRDYLPANRVLSLAYPDMVMPVAQVEEITGCAVAKFSHAKHQHRFDGAMAETTAVLRQMGAGSVRYVDIVRLREVEEIADLNAPCEFGPHDLVLDAGTTEHCANIWAATINAANAVDAGGVVIHCPPLNWVNHGFFGVQPTFYADLYGQNGWRLERCFLSDGEQCVDIDPHRRVSLRHDVMLCVAARRGEVAPMRYPVQHKYLGMIGGT